MHFVACSFLHGWWMMIEYIQAPSAWTSMLVLMVWILSSTPEWTIIHSLAEYGLRSFRICWLPENVVIPLNFLDVGFQIRYVLTQNHGRQMHSSTSVQMLWASCQLFLFGIHSLFLSFHFQPPSTCLKWYISIWVHHIFPPQWLSSTDNPSTYCMVLVVLPHSWVFSSASICLITSTSKFYVALQNTFQNSSPSHFLCLRPARSEQEPLNPSVTTHAHRTFRIFVTGDDHHLLPLDHFLLTYIFQIHLFWCTSPWSAAYTIQLMYPCFHDRPW